MSETSHNAETPKSGVVPEAKKLATTTDIFNALKKGLIPYKDVRTMPRGNALISRGKVISEVMVALGDLNLSELQLSEISATISEAETAAYYEKLSLEDAISLEELAVRMSDEERKELDDAIKNAAAELRAETDPSDAVIAGIDNKLSSSGGFKKK